MIKKLFFTIFVTSITLALFTGCPRPSDDQTHLILNVESDYSQMIIHWVWHYGLDNQFDDTKYFVYISKENDTAELSEPIYSGKDCITYHTVDEPGHYYVWVKAGENGSFSDPAEIDVSFIEPANIKKIEQTSTGLKLSYSIPNEPEARTIYGSYAKILYKKTIDEAWIENEYDLNFYRDSSEEPSKSFNFLEDGNYIFKIIVTDRYDKEVASKKSNPIQFVFNSEKYGKEPDCKEFISSKDLRGPDSQIINSDEFIDYFYFYAEEGESYEFNFVDYNRFMDDYTYFGAIDNKDKLAIIDCNIFISGTCTAINNDETEPDWDGRCFKINDNTKIFTCPRTAYYVIRCKKFNHPLHYNACNYYLDKTKLD